MEEQETPNSIESTKIKPCSGSDCHRLNEVDLEIRPKRRANQRTSSLKSGTSPSHTLDGEK